MSTDEYVPSDEEMISGLVQIPGEPAGMYRHVRVDEMKRGLARVRRDVLDELIADKAHMAALLHAENGGNVEDVLTHYRDTHYPEETP